MYCWNFIIIIIIFIIIIIIHCLLLLLSLLDSSSSCGIPPGTLFNLASRCLESAQQLFNQASEEKRQFATSQIMQSMPAAINRPNNVMTLPATINRSPTLPHDHQPPHRMMSDVRIIKLLTIT